MRGSCEKNGMIVLGINGLGVSPSACILVDGCLAAMAEEERFTRLKGSHGIMPALACRYCLSEAGTSLEDVDEIAFSWDADRYRLQMPLFLLRRALGSGALSRGAAGLGAGQLMKYGM